VRDGILVRGAGIARLLDPREDEDRVVGGEAEDHGEQEDQADHLDRRRPAVVEHSVEPPLLEREDEQAEGRGEREQVHQQRLHGEHQGPGEEEEQHEHRRRDEGEDQRGVLGQARLLVDEAGRVTRDEDLPGALEVADLPDRVLGAG
jgi:hypothetical protein